MEEWKENISSEALNSKIILKILQCSMLTEFFKNIYGLAGMVKFFPQEKAVSAISLTKLVFFQLLHQFL